MKIYRAPAKYLMYSVPLVLIIGFFVGLQWDTSFLKGTLMYGTITMIYATMIGINFKSLLSTKGMKVVTSAMLVNFIAIPLITIIIGFLFLKDYPGLYAGLALLALLPTSGMTIAWTRLQNANGEAAVKMTVIGLLLGAVLTPVYLYFMLDGADVDFEFFGIMKTILIVVLVPLVLGHLTYKLILTKYTPQEFNQNIKKKFNPLSIWAMLYVVFVSISNGAEQIKNNLGLIVIAALVLLLFYAVLFAMSTAIALRYFNRNDGIAFVNGTALRNLSIAMGLAATSFGAEAALLVTLSFIVQQQLIAMYVSISQNRWFNAKNFK